MASINCTSMYYLGSNAYRNIKTQGYGGTMFYALQPGARTSLEAMSMVSQAFFGENVVQQGVFNKDW